MEAAGGGNAGLLLFGMHRSGTSALAGLLGIGGANLGHRVLGASDGNETGHWEDVFAVDLHEELLLRFGTGWSDPFGLPRDWAASEVAGEAGDRITRYLQEDRARHRPWALKDPRLCLFAELWRDAAKRAGIATAAVLMLRPPGEIAASLHQRDGIGLRHAELLWLDYMQCAVQVVQHMPHAVVGYEQLLDAWEQTIPALQALPGGDALAYDADRRREVQRFLDPSRRHHRAASASAASTAVQDAWRVLSPSLERGVLAPGVADELARLALRQREFVRPIIEESRLQQRRLWERTAHAEARLAEGAVGLELKLGELRQFVETTHQDVVSLYSQDIRRMQGVAAEALAESAVARRALDDAKAETLAPLRERIDAIEQRLIAVYSDDIRRMQEVAARAAADAEAAHVALAQARLGGEQLQQANEALAAALQERDLRLGDASLSTRIDHLQRENASLAAQLEVARPKVALLEDIRTSHSWRMTRPLRVFRRVLTGRWSDSDGDRLRATLRQLGARMPFVPARARARMVAATLPTTAASPDALPDEATSHLLHLAARDQALPDVYVWSVIDWHFRTQRPQHLARALAAKGHRVFYISNNFADANEPGFRIDPLGERGRLFQIHLNLKGAPGIYFGMPDAAQVDAMRASLARLLAWTGTTSSISLVQHPFWTPLIRAVPNAKVVYDCMDHHAGFNDNANGVLEAEACLVTSSDLVVVTSAWLLEEIAPRARATALVRNAGEFRFFESPPAQVFRDPGGRRVIGYYGAIAEWFDTDLIRAVALANPEAQVILVGSDTSGAGEALADLPNVRMVGEVPYAELPYWLHGFDACLLPFKVIPLTMATNPVKVYEYLAAGKPVVSVDLPEMAQFEGLVRTARDVAGFVDAVVEVLKEGPGSQVAARQAFAAGQSWAHRAEALDQAIAAMREPRVSVVVLTYNNLAYTEACLFSLEAYSDYSDLEIIVVDNASTDGSPAWLQAWAGQASPAGHTRRLILNPRNAGFSAGNNIGLRAATGEVLVLLNNDTYVTPGWVRGLANHLRSEPRLGLVGPVTNNIGNEAKVDIHYADMAEMIAVAGARTRAHPGMRLPLATAAFFCVAMRRGVYEQVGGLDEQFGVGFFEDDDYCRRVEQAGYGIACAEDVFVHHYLSASFDALQSGQKQALFERNKALYEAKWGEWRPHAYRGTTEQPLA